MADTINVCLLIKHIWEREERYANAMLSSFGLTFTQSTALEYIASQDANLTQKALEEYMQIQHSAVVGIVSRLKAKGMIATANSPRDQRQKILMSTRKGRQVLEDIQEDKERVGRRLMNGLSDEQSEMLQKMLLRVYDNLGRNE